MADAVGQRALQARASSMTLSTEIWKTLMTSAKTKRSEMTMTSGACIERAGRRARDLARDLALFECDPVYHRH